MPIRALRHAAEHAGWRCAFAARRRFSLYFSPLLPRHAAIMRYFAFLMLSSHYAIHLPIPAAAP